MRMYNVAQQVSQQGRFRPLNIDRSIVGSRVDSTFVSGAQKQRVCRRGSAVMVSIKF